MSYVLPRLPYAYDALEPYLDARTMELHHRKHHAAYVTALNQSLAGHDFGYSCIDDLVAVIETLPLEMRTPARHFGGGHANHALFWNVLTPRLGTRPTGLLLDALERDVGDAAQCRTALLDAALSLFGAGWVWLAVSPEDKILVTTTSDEDSPLMRGDIPILALDVWEHAYYLKHQHDRRGYVEMVFNLIDWEAVGRRYAQALEKRSLLAQASNVSASSRI